MEEGQGLRIRRPQEQLGARAKKVQPGGGVRGKSGSGGRVAPRKDGSPRFVAGKRGRSPAEWHRGRRRKGPRIASWQESRDSFRFAARSHSMIGARRWPGWGEPAARHGGRKAGRPSMEIAAGGRVAGGTWPGATAPRVERTARAWRLTRQAAQHQGSSRRPDDHSRRYQAAERHADHGA